MNCKSIIAATSISLFLISLIVGIQSVEVAKANFVPQASIVSIYSPTNRTYTSNSLTLNVSVNFAVTKDKWIAYSIDGSNNVTLSGIEYQIDSIWQGINITAPLPAPSEGSHRLDIYAQSIPASYSSPDSKTVFFAIGTRLITVPTDYPTIQAAIDKAYDGDTIFVKSGTYAENPVINKSISIFGEDQDTTEVDVSTGFRIRSENVTLSGFTIRGKGGNGIISGTGISLEASHCNILGNRIKAVTHGLVLFQSNESYVDGNSFESIGLSSAIQLNFANKNLIKNNLIDSCVEGIQIWQSSNNNTVTENTITNCQDTAINFQYSNGNAILGNNITRSGIGTSIYGSNRNIISNNSYVYNFVQFGASETYYLTFGYNRSVNTIFGNYWSDYNGTDINGDGIGDSPYIIDTNNKDDYPLMKQSSSLNPFIPTPSPTVLPTTLTTTSPTPTLTAIPSQTTTPSSSPTQQLTPSPNPNGIQDNSTLTTIIAGLVVAAVIVSLLVYLAMHKRVKQ